MPDIIIPAISGEGSILTGGTVRYDCAGGTDWIINKSDGLSGVDSQPVVIDHLNNVHFASSWNSLVQLVVVY